MSRGGVSGRMRTGYVVLTLLFVAFWLAVFTPAIALMLVNLTT
jgi:hypothetical protein